MKSLVIICRSLLILRLLVLSIGQGQCSSQPDMSPTKVILTGSCGATTWQVGYIYKGATTIEFNSYSPAGDCGGNKYNCNCDYVDYYQNEGSVTSDVIQGENSENQPSWIITWTSDDWPVIQLVDCNPSDTCCDNGQDSSPKETQRELYTQFQPC